MRLLALETVTRSGSVAFWDDGACHGREGDATRTHGERLPGEVIAFLAEHQRRLQDLDLFAVVSGPGSFTGLRIGIAAIQGFASAGGRLVVPISTLDALATSWMLAPAGRSTLVVPCLDGLRDDLFAAAYTNRGQSLAEEGDLVMGPVVVTAEELLVLALENAEARDIVFVGNGARRHAAFFERASPASLVVDAPMPIASAAAYLAVAHADRKIPPHALRPFYLRRLDADVARERTAEAARVRAPAVPSDRAGAAAAAPAQAATPVGSFLTRRGVSDADLAAVDVLQRQTFTNPWGAESIRWELDNTDVARLYVMHRDDGPLVAYCACWMVFDELHINSLAVDPAWRRRGLARRLMNYVLKEAQDSGARSATLEVRGSNQAARGLYEGLGFKVEGVRRDYYQQPREDALILWHRMLQRPLDTRLEA